MAEASSFTVVPLTSPWLAEMKLAYLDTASFHYSLDQDYYSKPSEQEVEKFMALVSTVAETNELSQSGHGFGERNMNMPEDGVLIALSCGTEEETCSGEADRCELLRFLGFVSYSVEIEDCYDTFYQGPTGVINELYVRPSARGMGVAAALMKHAERMLAESLGCGAFKLMVSAHNPRAIKYYEREGWNSAQQHIMFKRAPGAPKVGLVNPSWNPPVA